MTTIMSQKHVIQTASRSLLALIITLVMATAVSAAGNLVSLPAGSVDGLAAALASAGPKGIVVVESGMHYESSTVVIGHEVTIIGEAGAIIEGNTTPNLDDGPPDFIDPVLHIHGARGVVIEGLTIQAAAGSVGNTAILIQDGPKTTIVGNDISGHEYGVVVQGGDHTEILVNSIHDISIFGILNINGQHVRISANTITRVGVFGIWLCDSNGICQFNSISQCFFGVMLCRFAEGDAVLPDGSSEGARSTATQWQLSNNESYENIVFGFLLTDGANNNILANNAAWDNGFVDILLDSEFEDFPASFENIIALGSYGDLSVLDFGIDNKISGEE